MKFSLRKCVKSETNECASDDDVKEFFKNNPFTRIMYNESYVSTSNPEYPLATAKKAELIENDPKGYKTVFLMYVMPIQLKGSDDLKFSGARITKTSKLFLPMPKDGKDQGEEIFELRLCLDSLIQKSKYSRYDWNKIVG